MKVLARVLAPGLAVALVVSVLATAGALVAAPRADAKTVAIAAGLQHNCAITPAGALYCWGTNVSGQLGDGTLDERATPVKVKKMAKGVVAVTAGSDHTCAIKGKKRTLLCWGYNLFGQLGNGESGGTADRRVPVKVKKMAKGVEQVSAGGNHTCAIKGKKDTLLCWGWNADGRLGIGIPTAAIVPVAVKVRKMAKGVKRISAGDTHACAIKGTKRILFCWGFNSDGRLGDGSTDQRIAPTKVKLGARVADVSADKHTCAIQGAKNALFCWGSNFAGQLGNGESGLGEQRLRPVKVKRMAKGVTAVAAGGVHTCAIKGKKRTLLCWGGNASGQLGIGDPPPLVQPLPMKVNQMAANVRAVGTGHNYACATKGKKGIPFCWGWNGAGQLGDGTAQPSSVPVKVKL